MPKKTRKSISLKGSSYRRLKQHCDGASKSASGTLEEWVYEKLYKLKPEVPYKIFAVNDAISNASAIYVCAQNDQQAAEWASPEIGTKANLLNATEVKDYDPGQITFGHLGVLTALELQGLVSRPAKTA